MTDAAKAVEAKAKVLSMYPDARFCPSYLDRGMVISGTPDNYKYHGDSWGENNEPAAWITAASRLTAVEEPAIAAQQRPICGHCGQILTGGIQRCSNDGYCCKEGQPELEAKEATGDFLYSRNKWYMLCSSLSLDAAVTCVADILAKIDEPTKDQEKLWYDRGFIDGKITVNLKPQPDSSSIPEIELELRRMMWLGHGHAGMYGDDGEMQCMECQPYGVVDYRNEPLDKVRETFRAVQMERMMKPRDSSSISTEVAWLEARWKSAFEEGKENYSNALIVALAALKSYAASEPGARVEEPAKPAEEKSDLARSLSSGYASCITITRADSAEGERIVSGWPDDKVREFATNWVARAEARQRLADEAIAMIRSSPAAPGDVREGVEPLLQGATENAWEALHRNHSELLAALQQVAEKDEVIGRERRTMKFWEESYLAEHGHWGNCTWKIRAESAEAELSRLRIEKGAEIELLHKAVVVACRCGKYSDPNRAANQIIRNVRGELKEREK